MSAKSTPPSADFNINTGLDDSHVVLQFPKDPVQIGTVVKDGVEQPVWVDPKDLIPTQEQKAEQAANMRGVAFEADKEKAMWEIAAQVEVWLDQKIRAMYPGKVDAGQSTIMAWCKHMDINFIEDNSDPAQYRFLLRKGDKIMSEFCASLGGKQ